MYPSVLTEEAIQIAWDYLERAGEIRRRRIL